MTRDELSDALAEIGWSIQKSGNGLNDHIVNHLGECTSFVVNDDHLEIRTNLFGGDTSMSRGNINFKLSQTNVRVDPYKDSGKVEWISLELGNDNFIQFFNHEKIKK